MENGDNSESGNTVVAPKAPEAGNVGEFRVPPDMKSTVVGQSEATNRPTITVEERPLPTVPEYKAPTVPNIIPDALNTQVISTDIVATARSANAQNAPQSVDQPSTNLNTDKGIFDKLKSLFRK